MKTLLFIRQGEIDDVDGTSSIINEEQETIDRTVDYMNGIVNRLRPKDLQITTSPSRGAWTLSDLIARKLSYTRNIWEERALRRMDIHDMNAVNGIWDRFKAGRSKDNSYLRDTQFDTGIVVERRLDIQNRFYEFLGNVFAQCVRNKLAEVNIYVTHLEVLWHLVQRFRFNDPLTPGEIIRLDLTPGASSINVQTTFRGATRVFVCQLPATLFANQFTD